MGRPRKLLDEQQGNLAGAREHQQIWRSIMELLDQLAELGTVGPHTVAEVVPAILVRGQDAAFLELGDGRRSDAKEVGQLCAGDCHGLWLPSSAILPGGLVWQVGQG